MTLLKPISSIFFVFITIFLIGCSRPEYGIRSNRININDYKNRKIDLYRYTPNLVNNMQKQVAADNKYFAKLHSKYFKVKRR